MTTARFYILSLVGLAGFCGPTYLAAQGVDLANWPCVQRYVPELSPGVAVLPTLSTDAVNKILAENPKISSLANHLAQRDLPLPDAQQELAVFLDETEYSGNMVSSLRYDLAGWLKPAASENWTGKARMCLASLLQPDLPKVRKEKLEVLLISLFEAANYERKTLLRKILLFGKAQNSLIEEMDRKARVVAEHEKQGVTGSQLLERMQADYRWTTRIFEQREESIPYLCEQPVLLERRFYALGKTLSGAVSSPE